MCAWLRAHVASDWRSFACDPRCFQPHSLQALYELTSLSHRHCLGVLHLSMMVRGGVLQKGVHSE